MKRFAPFIAISVLLVLVAVVVLVGRSSNHTTAVEGLESTPVPSEIATPKTTASAALPTPQETEVPSATVVATSTPKPAVVRQYQYPGNPSGKYFGLEIKSETTVYAPFDGTVGVVLVDKDPQGRLPQGKIFVRFVLVGGDKSIFSLALGEIGNDVILLAKNGTKVKAGDQLFTVVDFGPSFWKYTDDPSVNFQTVGYLKDPSGAFLEVDATFAKIFLKGRS